MTTVRASSPSALSMSRRAERLLVPAAFMTTVGNTFQITAVAILVFRAEQTTLAVGWLFIAVAIPQVVLSLFFGRLADRFDRRVLCLVADLLSAAVAMALPIWLWVGGPANIGSYASSFFLAGMAALFIPASGALIKERIRDERIGQFNAYYEMANNAGMLLAAAAAGFLVVLLGPIPLFVVNALTFIASAICTLGLGAGPGRAPAEAPTRAGSAQPTTGTVAPNRGRIIGRLGVLYGSGNVILVVSNALLTVLILDAFNASPAYIGIVDALAGIGFLIAAATYRFISPRISGLRLAIFGYLGSCAMIVLEPLHLWVLIAVIPISGFCFGLGRIAARTLLMREAPENRVGRIFGATQAFGLAYSVVATVGLSALSDQTNVSYGFWGTSLLVGGTVLVVGLSLARRMTVNRPQEPALAGSAA